MRRWLTPAAGVACLVASLVPRAAGQDQKAKPDAKAVFTEYLGLEDVNTQTNEDVEILGEVLRVALEKLYGSHGTVWEGDSLLIYPVGATTRWNRRSYGGSMYGYGDDMDEYGDEMYGYGGDMYRGRSRSRRSSATVVSGNVTVERPEGVYLPGYGVVYQVRLDVPPPEEEQSEVPAGKADEVRVVGGAWGNAQRTLRGQPPEPLGLHVDYGVPTKDDLVNKLLDVLAENVGNVRNLKPEDRLTMAITFPRGNGSAVGYGSHGEQGGAIFGAEGAAGYGSYGDEYGSSGYGDASAYGADSAEYGEYGSGMYGGGMEEGAYGASPRGPYGTSRRAGDSHEVSGDLHMRQGNYQKAIEAYEEALSAVSQRPTSEGKKTAGAVMRKLIQACTAAGDLEKARTLIDMALASKRKSENASSKPAHPIPLPARLVVSVTKSQLDEVASGKMTREELNKHATFYYFNPPPETPGMGPRASRASGGQRLTTNVFGYDLNTEARNPTASEERENAANEGDKDK